MELDCIALCKEKRSVWNGTTPDVTLIKMTGGGPEGSILFAIWGQGFLFNLKEPKCHHHHHINIMSCDESTKLVLIMKVL